MFIHSNVTKNTATPLVKADGTLALGTNGQETTISIDGAPISATQTADTFNVVDYILDEAAPAASQKYVISVSSEGYEGSVEHTLIPVNNANFKTTLKTATKDNMETRTYFLTEDVALTTADFSKSHNNMNWYSVFTNNYSNLDGRGHEISYVIVDESAFTFSDPNLGGIALGRHATWQNIYFDINIENATGGALVSDNWATIMSDNPDAAIINCYFDIDIAAANTSNFSLFGASTGLIKNNVFNVSAPAGITVYFAENGVAKTTPNFVNNVLIYDKASYQMFPGVYGNKTASGNVRYATMDAFIVGGNYYNIGNDNYSNTTFIEVESPVYNYNGWDVDATEKTIKLDGKVVYGTADKAALAVTLEENVLSFANNGELYDIFVTVDTNKQLIVENLYGSSYDLSTYLEEQGTALVGKTVTFTVESRGYTGSVDKTFEKIDAQMAIDNSGILTFNSGNQPVTLKINDAPVENVTSPYNLASYVYEQNITQTTTYNVVIESDICTGEISHQFIPLTDSNFKTELQKRVLNGGDGLGTLAYLTENITLDWNSGTDYGDFTNNFSDTRKAVVGASHVVYKTYANLDGRGYKITVNINNTDGEKYIGGIAKAIVGTWRNINFDFNVTAVGATAGYLVGSFADGGLVNCFARINSSAETALYLVAEAGNMNNVVVHSVGTSTSPFYFCNHLKTLSDIILIDDDAADVTTIGDSSGVNIGFTSYVRETYIYSKTATQSALEVFLAGGACKSATKVTDNNQMKDIKIADDVGGNKVSDWDNVWAFDATAGTVKLCGTTVATVPAAE